MVVFDGWCTRYLTIYNNPAVPGGLQRTTFHHHNTGLHQSSPPSATPKSSRSPMQVTTHKVDDNSIGNIRYDGSMSIRGKQHSHQTVPTSVIYKEYPWNDDNYFRSERDNLLRSLVLEKYGGSGKSFFKHIHCSTNFSGG